MELYYYLYINPLAQIASGKEKGMKQNETYRKIFPTKYISMNV